MKKLSFLSLFLFSMSAKVHAQTTLQKVHDLDSVVVHGQHIRLPFSSQNRDIVVLDSAVIESLPVKSVNELLSYVAGIDVQQRGMWGTQADISINGGTFDETLILLNGFKVIDPQTGHNMMNLPVSLDAIERIEILKGPAASAYGVNALNGAINIVTRQPKETRVTVNLFGGSSFKKDSSSHNLYTGGGIEATASLKTKNVSHFIDLSSIQSNGYRYNTPINNDKIFYSNKIDLGKSNLSLMGGFVYNDYGANGFYAAPNDVNARETVQTAFAAANANISMSEAWTMRPSISYRYSYDDYIFVRQHPEIYENNHFTNVVDAALNNSIYTTIGTFGGGIELRNENIRSNNLGHHDRTNIGFFGTYSLNLVPKLLVDFGLYANYSNDFKWDWMPSIDAGYELSKHWRLFANAGTGMRLPTYTDWYYTSPTNIGNNQLQPEKSWQTAVGVKYNDARINVSANYFYKNTSDMIDWVKDTITDPWRAENFQKLKTQGVSLNADYRLMSQTNEGFGLLVGASFTWLHSKADGDNDQGLLSQYALENLKNQMGIYAKVTMFKNFALTLSSAYQQRINQASYTLFSARFMADIHSFQLYFDANNITNVQYIAVGAVPMPGTWFTLGAKWNWHK